MAQVGQTDALVDERGSEEEEKPPSPTVAEINESVRKILTVSGTSLALAGITMSWLNSYLGKPLPDGRSRDNANLLSAQRQPDTFPISPEHLQILFISLGSSGIGILIGVAFIAYHISLILREMKSSETSTPRKRFKRVQLWSKCCHILLCFGVFLGFLSIAFAVLLFHNVSVNPFLSFLLPLVVSAALAVLAFYKLN